MVGREVLARLARRLPVFGLGLCMALGVLLCVPLPAFALDVRNDMAFDNVCEGNSAASCYILAVGGITADTPRAFRAFLEREQPEGNKVLLYSGGGNLRAGLDLGSIIRQHNYETAIGNWVEEGAFGRVGQQGFCMSACAYTFLGGAVRRIAEGNRLGFHRFFVPNREAWEKAGLTQDDALAQGQTESSLIVAYLVYMNIDPRIFVLGVTAGRDEMYEPDRATLEEFDLVSPDGFAPFYLEPYKSGIVAAAKRLGRTRLYDELTQVTAYCRRGEPHLLVSSDISLPDELPDPGDLLLSGADGQVQRIRVPRDRMRVRSGKSVEFRLDRETGTRVAGAAAFGVSVFLGQSAGGELRGTVPLVEGDRRMLDAAFRFCIDR
ncbi:COG3904 family protein [Stappia sp.]|uniref:COG3904 family protein n=1 Tax=Stappia sp. TaxID=1870903 RepID=UPI003A9A3FC3